MVISVVVDNTEIDMCQEFTRNVSDFFVLCVEFDSIIVILGIVLPKFHVVDTDAIVGEGLSVHITDRFANLKEFFVLIYSELVLAEVVKQHTCRIIRSTFVARLARTFAGKRQNVVVLQPFLCCDAVVAIAVAHLKSRVIGNHFL